MKNRTIVIILALIILFGGFLRFYKLGNSAFDRDEFFELNSSYGYFKTGHFVAWDFNDEKPFPADTQDDTSNERAEVFRWQLAQLYRFHEPTEFLTRALGSAWGVIGILLVYLITVSFTGNRYIALIAALLTAVGESEIIYSRRLRMYAMLFPMYLLFSWTVFKFYESKYKGRINFFKKIYEKIGFNFTYFLPVAIAGIISYNTHMLTAHIIPVAAAYSLLFLIILLLNKRLSFDKNFYFNKYFVTVAAAFIGFIAIKLPLFSQYYKIISKNFRFFRSNPSEDFFIQYFSDFNYAAVGVILALFGTWFLFKKLRKQKETAFLFFSMAVPLVFAIFTWTRDISHRYIYFIQSFGIILSAAGIYGIIYFITSWIKNYNYKKITAAVLLVVFLFAIDFGYISYKKATLNIAETSSYYPDFGKIFNYVKTSRNYDDALITRSYRSFYWRGTGMKTYDVKSLQMGAKGCENKIDAIVKENPSGWVVFPKIDKITVCAEGRKYYEENLTPIENDSIPSLVLVYRWGQ